MRSRWRSRPPPRCRARGRRRHMRIRSALLEDEAAQAAPVVFQERGRAHGACHQHGILRQPVARRRVVLADGSWCISQLAARSSRSCGREPAQIGVGNAAACRALVSELADIAFDRGLGGESRCAPPPPGGAASRGRRGTLCGRPRAPRDARLRPAASAALEQHVEVRSHGFDGGAQAA